LVVASSYRPHISDFYAKANLLSDGCLVNLQAGGFRDIGAELCIRRDGVDYGEVAIRNAELFVSRSERCATQTAMSLSICRQV
jgi:hypothetical protein